VVLIVEDQPTMRKMLRQFLEALLPHRTIVEASNGAQASELRDQCNPGLILMDVGLPDIDGIELTRRFKLLQPECRVIVVSMLKGAVYADKAVAAGAAAFISKDQIVSDLPPLLREPSK